MIDFEKGKLIFGWTWLRVANAFAGIMEDSSGDGDEFPAVFSWRERQVQDAIGLVVADFAVGLGGSERRVTASPSADDDFADAMLGVGIAFGILRREPFVGVFVSSQDQVGVRFVQILPECAQFGMLCVF